MKFLIALILLLLPHSALSEPLIFGTYYIPGLVINKDQGTFIKLHKEIMRRTQIENKLYFMPTKRVQYAFKHNDLISYFPELYESLPKKNVVVSEPFWFKKIIFYSLKDMNIHSTFDLEGLKLGAVHGYSYGPEIVNNKRIEIIYSDNDDINVKLLLNGRIDGILGDTKSTLAAINKSKFKDQFIYDLNKPINILDVFYVCQNSIIGKQTCSEISEAINQLKSEKLISIDCETGQSQINL